MNDLHPQISEHALQHEGVEVLQPREPARFDPAPLQRLVAEVGAEQARALVEERLERIAQIVARAIRLHRRSDFGLLLVLARELSALAESLGLDALSDAAAGLSVAAAGAEPVALGATLARVRRLALATPARLQWLRPEA